MASPSADVPILTRPRVFEDNVGALELANAHKLRPRTKHLSVQLHHFRQCVLDRKVIAEKICTAHQRADAFAKASPRDAFRCLRSTVSGWQTFARECHEHVIASRRLAFFTTRARQTVCFGQARGKWILTMVDLGLLGRRLFSLNNKSYNQRSWPKITAKHRSDSETTPN